MESFIKVEQREELAVVRIDRPPANAISLDVVRQAIDVMAELGTTDPGAVVLTGRDEFFSAGADLKLVPTLDADGQREMVDGINRLFGGWYSFPRPVVAAVNGHAIAGGLILALAADYRVGATEGKLGLTELKAGVPYPAAAMCVVQAELTPAAARVLVFRNHLVEGDETLRLGLVDEVAPPAEVLDRALAVASELAVLPRSGYGLVKRQLRGPTIARIEQVIAGEDPLVGSWLIEGTASAAANVLGKSPPG